MDLGIKGKVAIVSGADSGIGLATAKLLAQEGVNLILNDKTKDELKLAAEQVKKQAMQDIQVEYF